MRLKGRPKGKRLRRKLTALKTKRKMNQNHIIEDMMAAEQEQDAISDIEIY
jgi:hypothetical protein